MIPENFFGTHYSGFLSAISAKRATKNYLEIGVDQGENLALINCERAIAIDPAFRLNQNITQFKNKVDLFQETSDNFFASYRDRFGENFKLDMSFLDGMHLFEFIVRDFMNTEMNCKANSVIFMHDCLPLNSRMAQRTATKGSDDEIFKDYWTGDVWKIIPILKKFRPELKLTIIDCPPTGLVAVSNLKPDNKVLSDNYFSIVSEFGEMENSEKNISDFYETFNIDSSQKILNGFDHSLYI